MHNFLLCILSVFLVACATSPPNQTKPVASRVVAGSEAGTYVITLDARSEWFNTGIRVPEGAVMEFSADGTWGESPGVKRSPNGGDAGMFGSGYWGLHRIEPNAPWGALVGKLGPRTFAIGSLNTITATQEGLLQLAINDALGQFQDNVGQIRIVFRIR